MYGTMKKLRSIYLSILVGLGTFQSVLADETPERHELENMRVTIQASEYKKSKFIEEEHI